MAKKLTAAQAKSLAVRYSAYNLAETSEEKLVWAEMLRDIQNETGVRMYKDFETHVAIHKRTYLAEKKAV